MLRERQCDGASAALALRQRMLKRGSIGAAAASGDARMAKKINSGGARSRHLGGDDGVGVMACGVGGIK